MQERKEKAKEYKRPRGDRGGGPAGLLLRTRFRGQGLTSSPGNHRATRGMENKVQLDVASRRLTSALRTEGDKVKGWKKVFHANRTFFKKQR